MEEVLEREQTVGPTSSAQQVDVTLEKVMALATHLSVLDKVRLIEWLAPQIEERLKERQPKPTESLYGMCADLGPAPSAEEIHEARLEAWANFPRDDV